jgi:GT2 family glycosyltransferase
MNLDEKTLLALPKANGLTEVGFNGFGFMLIKRGVFEAVEYPWFEPHFTTYDNVRDFSGEDTGFCIKARRKGFKILVDIAVKVGHEKRFVY